MPVIVEPLKFEDFDELDKYADSPEGDLSHPLLLVTWPVDPAEDPEGARARNKWSNQHARYVFRNDPTARFVKAVDTDINEIIALARWHYYEDGFKYPEFLAQEMNWWAPDGNGTYPEGQKSEQWEVFLKKILAERPGWMKDGPQWVLTTLVTRPGHRRKGGGSLLSKWGIEQAKKDGVPAHVESSTPAVNMYASCGFKEVEKWYVNMPEFGVPPEHYNTRMSANTQG